MDEETIICYLEMNDRSKNIEVIEQEIQWFSEMIEARFNSYFGEDYSFDFPAAPDVVTADSPYGFLVKSNNLSDEERALMMLVLVPHYKPEILDIFFTKNSNFDRPFTEFGGVAGKYYGGFLPTVETANFILSGGNLDRRHQLLDLFSANAFLIEEDIVRVGEFQEESNEPFFSKSLTLNPVYRDYFVTGIKAGPESLDVFPARKIETHMEWSDLVLEESVRSEIDYMCTWVNGENTLRELNAVKKYIKPGFRCLFYGPPGTGKTLTATLIGKETNREVYRIDLSMIVSKYIGETEKNLSKVFDYAEKRSWILFFDEADALFGRRTQTNSSNDRFANQEVAYLLQRIEAFPGIVILASNLKSNIDEAFSRRFQSMIYFPMPDENQRLQLWENMFSSEVELDANCSLRQLAENYELSGGSAINVFRFGLLKAMTRESLVVTEPDLIEGIRKEYQKYGRTL